MKTKNIIKKLIVGVFALGLLSTLGYMAFADIPEASTGSFHISQQNADGEWEETYLQSYEVEYQTHNFDFEKVNDQVKLRIVQRDQPFGDVEQVSLTACGDVIEPTYAQYTESGEDISADLRHDDLNVIVAHEKEFKILWDIPSSCNELASMALTANEYGHAHPFQYPTVGYLDFDANPEIQTNFDGFIDEVLGQTADYETVWNPVTGHPVGTTYIYASEDAENAYLSLDITMDNTDDFGEDYLLVRTKNADGELAEFLIDDYHLEYGLCGFGLTDTVSYKHQTCEAAIPKAEIGTEYFAFSVEYYGTGGGPFPVCGNGTIEGNEECDDNNTSDGDGCSAGCYTEVGDWTQINTDNFGDANTQGAESKAITLHNSKVYVGTINFDDGGGVWELDGDTWSQVNIDGFGDSNNESITTLEVYDSKLYAGTSNDTTGTEIWEYSGTGTTWTQINTDGFGSSANTKSTSMTVFDPGTKIGPGGSSLIVGTANTTTGGQVHYYNGTTWTALTTDGFGNSDNREIESLEVNTQGTDSLMAGTRNYTDAAELWYYDTDPVEGGWYEEETGGFGDSGNLAITDLYEISGTGLYAATLNTSADTEVWEWDYAEDTWSQVNSNGFGNGYDEGVQLVYHDSELYTITAGFSAPTRLYKYTGAEATWTVESTTGMGANAYFGAGLLSDGTTLYIMTGGGEGEAVRVFIEEPPVCGNGSTEGSEECDDGNTTSGDGCSATCTYEPLDWNQINTDDFGDANTDGLDSKSVAVYNGKVYVGTANYDDGTGVWEYDSGTWSQINTDGFGDANNKTIRELIVYNNKLYAGTGNATTGAEVWEYDSAAWTQVNTDGFGDSNNRAIWSFGILYDGPEQTLFAGTQNQISGGQVYSFDDPGWTDENADGFGDLDNTTISALSSVSFEGMSFMMAGTRNAIDGAEVWSLGFEGWFDDATQGFGDLNNVKINDLLELPEGRGVYAATENSTTGTEIWHNDFGPAGWTQINQDGFVGDDDNDITSQLVLHNNEVYGITVNFVDGAEVYKYGEEGTTWHQMNTSGFESSSVFGMGIASDGTDLYAISGGGEGEAARVFSTLEGPAGTCGDEVLEGDEECDTNEPGGQCTNCVCNAFYESDGSGGCQAEPICGNEVFETGEECDSLTPADHCAPSCTCESGYVANGSGVCNAVSATCPNSILETGEECDSSSNCSPETCTCESGYTADPDGNCSTWHQVNEDDFEDGSNMQNIGHHALTLYNGKIYAGVDNTNGGQIWEYDYYDWTLIKDDFADELSEMIVYSGELYVGSRDGTLIKYNGTSWTDVTPNPPEIDDSRDIDTMFVHDGNLFVGGGALIGGSIPNVILKYNGTTWTFEANMTDLGTGTIYEVSDFEVLDTGELIASLDANTYCTIWKRSAGGVWSLWVDQGIDYINNDWIDFMYTTETALYVVARYNYGGVTVYEMEFSDYVWDVIATRGWGDGTEERVNGLVHHDGYLHALRKDGVMRWNNTPDDWTQFGESMGPQEINTLNGGLISDGTDMFAGISSPVVQLFSTVAKQEQVYTPACGNSILDHGEQCDGTNPNCESCQCTGGTVSSGDGGCRASTSTAWEKVSNASLEASANTAPGKKGLIVYDGALWEGTQNASQGPQIFKYSNETWTNETPAGWSTAGNTETGAMIVYDGDLYVTLNNDTNGVYVWKHEQTTGVWSQFGGPGPGSWDSNTIEANALTVWDDPEAGGEILVMGTKNALGPELWSFDSENWYAYGGAFDTSFAEVSGLEIFDGTPEGDIFVGLRNETGGATMQNCHWAYGEGPYWDCTTFDNEGFGEDNNNVAITGVVSNATTVYAVTENDVTGVEVWEMESSDGIWDRQINGDGFGNANNTGASAILLDGTDLYIGTTNTVNGAQVWKYDGSDWVQLNLTGFGSSQNKGIYGLAIFNEELYGSVWGSNTVYKQSGVLPAVTQIAPLSTDPALSDSTPLFEWLDIAGEDHYHIEVTLSTDTTFTSVVLSMNNVPGDSTSQEATSALADGDYIWRIYGLTAGDFGDPDGANVESFTITGGGGGLNFIPEFETYLLIAILLLGTGFAIHRRKQIMG